MISFCAEFDIAKVMFGVPLWINVSMSKHWPRVISNQTMGRNRERTPTPLPANVGPSGFDART
eukprot:10541113-Lingulodinium_polyedra.AAC.1